MTVPTAPLATAPIVRALVEKARAKNIISAVIGIRARPTWDGPDLLTHDGLAIRVVPCPSALAVREALLDRAAHPWLVVLTDRSDEDLGTGLRAHLLGHKLQNADPWEAVRRAFAATGIDSTLVAGTQHRDIAAGLLDRQPGAGWPPARGGMLTADHAYAAVARAWLNLPATEADARDVLVWAADPANTRLVAALRETAADPLTDAVLAWIANRCGTAAPPLAALLANGRATEALPLGLAIGVLTPLRDATRSTQPGLLQQAREALVRLETRTGGRLDAAVARAWAGEAAEAVRALLAEPSASALARRCLDRADTILAEADGEGLSLGSDLLPSGLTGRLAVLSDALRTAFPTGRTMPPTTGELDGIEAAWAPTREHVLADIDARVAAFRAAVRLSRWLSLDDAAPGVDLPALACRQRDVDAWVDSAVNDAASGVADPGLGAGLEAVLSAARARRAGHDREFATALSLWTSADGPNPTDRGLWRLEDVLAGVVLPATRHTGVLFLILDGMSTGVGTEVLDSVLRERGHGWVEVLLPGHTRRAAGIAVLPTLTHISRASMLCGELRAGGQDVERSGYAGFAKANNIGGALLFHKKPLDTSRLGHSVADDVAAAITDTTRHRLVTCVLNSIDDALDRDDPGGVDWAIDAVKHLGPLLEIARLAGRSLIITADHGHIVERRLGTQRPHPGISSGRSRPAQEPVEPAEVRVQGRRVLEHGGAAVLAVDETLRYGPLKAGYHGGGAPAEVVVPLAVLVPGIAPPGSGWVEAPPQSPTWWIAPLKPVIQEQPAAAPVAVVLPRGSAERPSLFDEDQPEPAAPSTTTAGAPDPGAHLVAAVLESGVLADQRAIAGRVSVTDEDLRRLLSALLGSVGYRLDETLAAQALGVPVARVQGAVAHAQKLLNVEGYAVLRRDSDGRTLVLDMALLREQFGIGDR